MQRKENTFSAKECQNKFCFSCIENCVEWYLEAKLNLNNQEYFYRFSAQSMFFRTLDISNLNAIQNNLNYSEKIQPINFIREKYGKKIYGDTNNDCDNIKDKVDVDKINVEKINKDQEKKISICELKDKFIETFPINNMDFNFMIIDSNLGFKENLNNIFFIEFDFINDVDNIEKIKLLSEINNDKVSKEISFTLNANIHGLKFFIKDIAFNQDYRQIIKSMQFRLENHKNELIEIDKFSEIVNKEDVKLKTKFFSKILTNVNIGIEFYKQPSENLINFQTNFNSIVNSNISLSKIFLEVSIPKELIKNNYLFKKEDKKLVEKNEENGKYLNSSNPLQQLNNNELNSENLLRKSKRGYKSTRNTNNYTNLVNTNDTNNIIYPPHNNVTFNYNINNNVNFTNSNTNNVSYKNSIKSTNSSTNMVFGNLINNQINPIHNFQNQNKLINFYYPNNNNPMVNKYIYQNQNNIFPTNQMFPQQKIINPQINPYQGKILINAKNTNSKSDKNISYFNQSKSKSINYNISLNLMQENGQNKEVCENEYFYNKEKQPKPKSLNVNNKSIENPFSGFYNNNLKFNNPALNNPNMYQFQQNYSNHFKNLIPNNYYNMSNSNVDINGNFNQSIHLNNQNFNNGYHIKNQYNNISKNHNNTSLLESNNNSYKNLGVTEKGFNQNYYDVNELQSGNLDSNQGNLNSQNLRNFFEDIDVKNFYQTRDHDKIILNTKINLYNKRSNRNSSFNSDNNSNSSKSITSNSKSRKNIIPNNLPPYMRNMNYLNQNFNSSTNLIDISANPANDNTIELNNTNHIDQKKIADFLFSDPTTVSIFVNNNTIQNNYNLNNFDQQRNCPLNLITDCDSVITKSFKEAAEEDEFNKFNDKNNKKQNSNSFHQIKSNNNSINLGTNNTNMNNNNLENPYLNLNQNFIPNNFQMQNNLNMPYIPNQNYMIYQQNLLGRFNQVNNWIQSPNFIPQMQNNLNMHFLANNLNNNSNNQNHNLNNMNGFKISVSLDEREKINMLLKNNLDEKNDKFMIKGKKYKNPYKDPTNVENFKVCFNGMTNFDIFCDSISINLSSSIEKTYTADSLTLNDLINNLEKISIMGLEIFYIYNNEIVPSTYSPTLSGFELNIKNKRIISEILVELKKKNIIKSPEIDKLFTEVLSYDKDDLNKMEYKFFEINKRIQNKLREIEHINCVDLDMENIKNLVNNSNKIPNDSFFDKNGYVEENKENDFKQASENNLKLDAESNKKKEYNELRVSKDNLYIKEETKSYSTKNLGRFVDERFSRFEKILNKNEEVEDKINIELNKAIEPHLEIISKLENLNFECKIKDYTLRLNEGVLKIQYSESKPHYMRKTFYDELRDLIEIIPQLSNHKLLEFCPESWLAILWNPYKSTKGIFNNSSFLVYYSIDKYIKSLGFIDRMNNYIEKNVINMSIKGILPIKFDFELFSIALMEEDDIINKKSVVSYINYQFNFDKILIKTKVMIDLSNTISQNNNPNATVQENERILKSKMVNSLKQIEFITKNRIKEILKNSKETISAITSFSTLAKSYDYELYCRLLEIF